MMVPRHSTWPLAGRVFRCKYAPCELRFVGHFINFPLPFLALRFCFTSVRRRRLILCNKLPLIWPITQDCVPKFRKSCIYFGEFISGSYWLGNLPGNVAVKVVYTFGDVWGLRKRGLLFKEGQICNRIKVAIGYRAVVFLLPCRQFAETFLKLNVR